MRQSHRALYCESRLYAALEIHGAVICRSRYLADLRGTKFSRIYNVPNCSIAFAKEAYSPRSTQSGNFFLVARSELQIIQRTAKR
jgi:hypothetical protein